MNENILHHFKIQTIRQDLIFTTLMICFRSNTAVSMVLGGKCEGIRFIINYKVHKVVFKTTII